MHLPSLRMKTSRSSEKKTLRMDKLYVKPLLGTNHLRTYRYLPYIYLPYKYTVELLKNDLNHLSGI